MTKVKSKLIKSEKPGHTDQTDTKNFKKPNQKQTNFKYLSGWTSSGVLPKKYLIKRKENEMREEKIEKIYSIKTYGVEIECYIPDRYTLQEVAATLTDTGIKTYVKLYTHQFKLGEWKIVPDGSLRQHCPAGYQPLELVSPPLTDEEDGYAQIEKACFILNGYDAVIKKSCGLHVHVGYHKPASNRVDTTRQLINFYAKNEDYFDMIQPESRRESVNQFCTSLKDRVRHIQNDFENDYTYNQTTIASIFNHYLYRDRYFKVNLGAYVKYGTMEFRHHSGTTESKKIISWVKICRALCAKSRKEIARTGLKKADTFEDFLNEIRPYTDDDAIQYLVERYAKFTKNALPF